MFDPAALSAEFPRNAVSWRAQSMTKSGDKALALAYIDARDVMDRLDKVCGPENWQDRYEFHGPRTVCYLSLRIGNEWVTKADGAGDSDVEAEKGAISDALKRAAVKWGVGRYLYAIETPWVPCESYESNGKKHWKRWTADPWSCVRSAPSAPAHTPDTPTPSKSDGRTIYAKHEAAIRAATTKDDLRAAWSAAMADKESIPLDWQPKLVAERDAKILELGKAAAPVKPNFDHLQTENA